jgi:3-hydroxybutyryl-CoA dehydrogenase
MQNQDINHIEVGVVGLGLMGSSIVICLLCSGHKVKAIAPMRENYLTALSVIKRELLLAEEAGLLQHPIDYYLARLEISEEYEDLASCKLVFECVIEKPEIKFKVYKLIADTVPASTLIATNTSALPISFLQKTVPHPERFLGIHWAEPAYMTRFLEITKGAQTSQDAIDYAQNLAYKWGKEPTVLKKDIRGFITNRLMYAVYREALHLEACGVATIEDLDKAFRYDAGSWMTFMGVFQRLDMLGVADYRTIFTNLFPALSNAGTVPVLMEEMIGKNARGTKNRIGFYTYNKEEGESWDSAFARFNRAIYKLVADYPSLTLKKVEKDAVVRG